MYDLIIAAALIIRIRRSSKGIFMKKHEGQKTNQPVHTIFHTACISLLSFFLLCGSGYASSDAPVNINSAPAAMGVAAGFGGGSALTILAAVAADIGSTADSTFDTAFSYEESGYMETLPDAGTASRSKQGARSACTESCSL